MSYTLLSWELGKVAVSHLLDIVREYHGFVLGGYGFALNHSFTDTFFPLLHK